MFNKDFVEYWRKIHVEKNLEIIFFQDFATAQNRIIDKVNKLTQHRLL